MEQRDRDDLAKIQKAHDYERVQTYVADDKGKTLGPITHRSAKLGLEVTEWQPEKGCPVTSTKTSVQTLSPKSESDISATRRVTKVVDQAKGQEG